MTDIDSILSQLDDVHTPDLWESIRRSGPRRGDVRPPRGPHRAIAFTVAILVAAGGLSLAYRAFSVGEGDTTDLASPVPSPTQTDPSPTPVETKLSSVPDGWTALADPPDVRSASAAKVWTGAELLVWGGHVYSGSGDDPPMATGYLWEPLSGDVRVLPSAPLAARDYSAFAWSGTELIVWGGGSPDQSFGDGAVYSGVRDTWRTIAEAPVGPRVPLVHVWSGEELLIWGDSRDPASNDGAAYDPDSDTWRLIAPTPPGYWLYPVWTGSSVVVFNNADVGMVSVASYDPRSDRWTKLPQPPLSWIATAAWDGSGVVAWANNHEIARYDPVSGVWTSHPSAPLPSNNDAYYPIAVGGPGFILGTQLGEAALFEAQRGRWLIVTQAEFRDWDTHELIVAGDVVIDLRRNNETRQEGAFVLRP